MKTHITAHTACSTSGQTTFKIEQHGEEYTVTLNHRRSVVVVTCSADRLRDVLAMVCE